MPAPLSTILQGSSATPQGDTAPLPPTSLEPIAPPQGVPAPFSTALQGGTAPLPPTPNAPDCPKVPECALSTPAQTPFETRTENPPPKPLPENLPSLQEGTGEGCSSWGGKDRFADLTRTIENTPTSNTSSTAGPPPGLGKKTGGALRYSPDHNTPVVEKLHRVFVKKSLSGIALKHQSTVMYAFAKEGGGYSMGDLKWVLKREGLAAYTPVAFAKSGEEFGTIVERYFPEDQTDFRQKGEPVAVITGEVLTFGDLVWRLYDFSILDNSIESNYNMHREKFGKTSGFSSARALFSTSSEGSVAAATEVIDDFPDEEFEEAGPGERREETHEEKVIEARRLAVELDEMRRLTAESGLDELEEEVTELTVTKEKYDDLKRRFNLQTSMVQRAFRTVDNLTGRVDNFAKENLKLTNKQLATVVQASLEPLVKNINELKRAVITTKLENHDQSMNYFKVAMRKHKDEASKVTQQFQQVHNICRNLLPAPTVKQPSTPAFPPPQGFPPQGYQSSNVTAPAGFPGPPPTFGLAPPSFSMAPSIYNPTQPSYNNQMMYQGPMVTQQAQPQMPQQQMQPQMSQQQVQPQMSQQQMQPPQGNNSYFQVSY